MKIIVNTLIFTIFFLQNSIQFCKESEFIIQKKPDFSKNDSSNKIKEKIIKTSGDVLKLDVSLAQLSVDIRQLLLDEIESCFENDKENFICNANKQELKNALNELNYFKEQFEKTIKNVEKNFTSLKKKFCVVNVHKN